MEGPTPYQLIDQTNEVTALLDRLTAADISSHPIYIDLEGVNLSRNGSISLIQLYVPHVGQVQILDVHRMGARTFSTTSARGVSLKSLLESKERKKYFFDVRNDSDALNSLFGIRLAGVTDVQLLELACRKAPRVTLSGLARCIEQDSGLPCKVRKDWESTKAQVKRKFNPEASGTGEVFNERPLPEDLLRYCAGDVQFLPVLASKYQARLSPAWPKKVAQETTRRLEESWGPDYQPKGKHKVFGPKAWT